MHACMCPHNVGSSTHNGHTVLVRVETFWTEGGGQGREEWCDHASRLTESSLCVWRLRVIDSDRAGQPGNARRRRYGPSCCFSSRHWPPCRDAVPSQIKIWSVQTAPNVNYFYVAGCAWVQTKNRGSVLGIMALNYWGRRVFSTSKWCFNAPQNGSSFEKSTIWNCFRVSLNQLLWIIGKIKFRSKERVLNRRNEKSRWATLFFSDVHYRFIFFLFLFSPTLWKPGNCHTHTNKQSLDFSSVEVKLTD